MKKRDTIYVLVILLLIVWFIYFLMNYVHVEVDEPLPKTEKTTSVDTIPYYKPIPKDSVVLRYQVVKAPIASKDSTKSNDSAEVIVPITQKEYEDSSYHVWISGHIPKLDSIKVYNKNTIITHTITSTITKYKTKNWGIGVQAGYGYNFNKASPYIGIGIQYNILNW